VTGRCDDGNFVGADTAGMENGLVERPFDETDREGQVVQARFHAFGVRDGQIDRDTGMQRIEPRNRFGDEKHAAALLAPIFMWPDPRPASSASSFSAVSASVKMRLAYS
jgi:hypothetical protein